MRAFPYRHWRRIAVLGALSLYLAAMLWYARFHLLDDALIHLRLAELLLTHGFVTANGQAASFGTSSPVFLLLTAGLHVAIESDLTTKAISVVAYLAFIAGLLALIVFPARPTGWQIAGSVLVIAGTVLVGGGAAVTRRAR